MLADIERPPCPPRSRTVSDAKLESPPAAAAAAPDSTLAAIYLNSEVAQIQRVHMLQNKHAVSKRAD